MKSAVHVAVLLCNKAENKQLQLTLNIPLNQNKKYDNQEVSPENTEGSA